MHKVLLTPTMGSIKPGLKGLTRKNHAHITLDVYGLMGGGEVCGFNFKVVGGLGLAYHRKRCGMYRVPRASKFSKVE